MGALVFFFPELLIVAVLAAVLALVLFVWLLFHLGSFVRNTIATAGVLLTWALQAGFVGFIVYIAAWVFIFPVMAGLCAVGGLARTWVEARVLRELKRQAHASRKGTGAWYVSAGVQRGAEIIPPSDPR